MRRHTRLCCALRRTVVCQEYPKSRRVPFSYNLRRFTLGRRELNERTRRLAVMTGQRSHCPRRLPEIGIAAFIHARQRCQWFSKINKVAGRRKKRMNRFDSFDDKGRVRETHHSKVESNGAVFMPSFVLLFCENRKNSSAVRLGRPSAFTARPAGLRSPSECAVKAHANAEEGAALIVFTWTDLERVNAQPAC